MKRTRAIVSVMVIAVSALTSTCFSQEYPLWSGAGVPSDPNSIPFAAGVTHVTLLDGSEHTHHFLHGAAIINVDGVFYANWANSPTNENYPDETLQGRRFTDAADTNTWSDVEVIAPGFSGTDERHSHAGYLEHQGELWTFAGRFGVGDPGVRFDGLRAEAFVLNETNDQWESRGVVMTNCWPYEEPVRMTNGNFIVGGQDKDGLPVVAISHGDDLTRWDSVLIPYQAALAPRFAETTVWAEGTNVTAVIRGGEGVAWVATSADGGRTWAEARPSNLPMPRAKAYLGKLSTGQLYLISNLSNRNTLCVSASRPGESTLSAMWRIRHGSSSPVPEIPGFAKAPQWSYPYGYEHDGNLYVVYSIGKEDCGLSVIPIASLYLAPPTPPTDADLVALYYFEDDVSDSSGNGYHAGVDGTAVYSDASIADAISGRSTKAFTFDSSANVRSIDLPHGGVDFYNRAQTTGVSISFWFKAGAQQEKYLFSIGNTYDDDPIYGIQAGPAGATSKLRRFYRTDDRHVTAPISTTAPLDDRWHHFAMTDYRGDVKVYFDGVEDATGFDYTPVAFTPNFIALGALARVPDGFWPLCHMDEVAIYSRVLLPREVARLAAGEDPASLPLQGAVIVIE